MGYKNGNTDSEGLINHEDTSWENFKRIDEAYDRWDSVYGDGKPDFLVYVLTDPTKPIKLQFGPLEFYHEPFYVGYGDVVTRLKDTVGVGRQKDKYRAKTARLLEIRSKGHNARKVIIGRYATREKAMLVERKIMNTINKSFLTNHLFHYCEVPLTVTDCNVMYECEYTDNEIPKGPLTC